MNYLIFFTVIAILAIVIKNAKTVVKAANRINLLYNYFIVDQKSTTGNLNKIIKLSSSPDPNDGSGCPKESELTNEN